MRAVTRRRVVLIALVLAAIAAAGSIARPYVGGLSFVIRAAELHGTARRLADLDTVATRERELQIPAPGGALRARLYEPAHAIRRTALLVSGLHPADIDEPRLVRFARQIAASGVAVVTPHIPALSRFEITPAITDAVEGAALWLASQRALAPDGKIGMIGVSFSGGLSLVAAGRPSLDGRVAYVFSIGGHGDLPRVLEYLCTGVAPRPADRPESPNQAPGLPPPHDYGVAVILLGVAEHLVPMAQVEPLREAVRRFLWASALDGGLDKARAPREFAAVGELTESLPEPSATLLRHVVDRDVGYLGPRLLPHVRLYGADPALSASRSRKTSAPVFLLHGSADNVIPAFESVHLANDLRGHAPVRLLLSGLITHATAGGSAHVGEVLSLAAFAGDLLSR